MVLVNVDFSNLKWVLGQILESADIPWGKPGLMWAPDCVCWFIITLKQTFFLFKIFKDGVYYFYFPHVLEGDEWLIGVCASKEPAANFVYVDYIHNISSLIG
jgi:hypothetical protein